jgi:enediyne biosynthesis protein E4
VVEGDAVIATLALLLALQDTGIVFRDASRDAGLGEPLDGIAARCAAWGDVDGDGRPELLVGAASDLAPDRYGTRGPVSTRLFRNAGGRFERAPESDLHAATLGALFVDLDNDGDCDLYLANASRVSPRPLPELQLAAQAQRPLLLRNDGGRFTDVSDTSGACPPHARAAHALDFDANGYLDLLVFEQTPEGLWRSHVFLGKGEMRFVPGNAATGIPEHLEARGVAIAELNGDLLPDLFVARANRLFLSGPGGRYREAPRETFRWSRADGEGPSGVAFGDVNGDGLTDLVLTSDRNPARLHLWINGGLRDGAPAWRDATVEAGLDALIPSRASHCELQDFDNDGRLDLLVSCAWVDSGGITPLVFRNTGGRDHAVRFETVRPLPAPEPPMPRDRFRPRAMVSFAAGPAADYDGDGRLDVALASWSAHRASALLRNETAKQRWLDVRVTGRTFNRMGVGVKVRVWRDRALLGTREIALTSGYASAGLPVAHFGLGRAASVDVEVLLPDGSRVERKGVAADQALVVAEP